MKKNGKPRDLDLDLDETVFSHERDIAILGERVDNLEETTKDGFERVERMFDRFYSKIDSIDSKMECVQKQLSSNEERREKFKSILMLVSKIAAPVVLAVLGYFGLAK